MARPYYEQGAYRGEVIQQGLGKVESSGNTQFVLRFRVLQHGDGTECAEYERTIYMVITPKTVERVVKDLRKLGYPHDSFGPLDPGHPSHHSFAGQQFDVYCKHENDQKGEAREKWSVSNPPASMEIKPIDSRDIRELDMLFGKTLKASSRPQSHSQPQPKPQPTLVSELEITDDDIPF